MVQRLSLAVIPAAEHRRGTRQQRDRLLVNILVVGPPQSVFLKYNSLLFYTIYNSGIAYLFPFEM